MILRVLSATLLVALLTTAALAENWPNWRGPDFNGVAAEGEYPTEWTSKKNVRWQTELPGEGSSTPAVWEQRIYLTSGNKGKNSLLCLDRATGRTQWTLDVGKERKGKHRKASGSNPSPATDGKIIAAYFKSGDLAAADLQGNLKWHVNLQEEFGEDTLWWDLGTSPVLTKDHVVVACMQSGPSYLAAFDKRTGKLAWKQDRMLNAPDEAAQSYSTPVLTEYKGQPQLIVLGADHVTAHDAETGKELWRVGGLNPTQHRYFRSISSPVISGDIVIAPYARGGTLTAIRMGGSGDVTKSHVLWTLEGPSADVPTPAAVNGRVYVCKDKGPLYCLEAKTGKEVWKVDLPRSRASFSSSPIVAGDRVYLTREDGITFVVDAANDKPEVVAENELAGEFTVASPVLVDGQVLVRSVRSLFCIGQTGAE